MKITKKENPKLFKVVGELVIEDSYKEHRKGSTFYTKSIIQITEQDSDLFPNIENFSDYIGYWESDEYISSEDYDEGITELTKVEKIKVMVEVDKWVEV